MNHRRFLDVSTLIGCPLNCSYCPQSVLLSAYGNEKRLMDLDDIKSILKNVDKSISLVFAGFGENFFNPHFVDILIYSFTEGYEISLWTTLHGFNGVKLNELKRSGISFKYCGFHQLVENKQFFDTLHSFHMNIPCEKWDIHIIEQPLSRAGNLPHIKSKYDSKPIICNFKYNGINSINTHNLVLPNGDVVICCMDYGLKHKIGNLHTNNYDSSEFNNKKEELAKLLLVENSDIICRKCECNKLIL